MQFQNEALKISLFITEIYCFWCYQSFSSAIFENLSTWSQSISQNSVAVNFIFSSCQMQPVIHNAFYLTWLVSRACKRNWAPNLWRIADYWVQLLIPIHQKLWNFQQTTPSVLQWRCAVRCAKFYVALEGRRHWTSKEEQRKHFFVTTTTG